MTNTLRIMCWNIAEGSMTGSQPPNSLLPLIAEQIRNLNPHVVLLNEVRFWRDAWSGVNQVEALSDATGLPERHWAHTTMTGLTGHKGVGILSRYPLGAPIVHPVIRNGDETSFATLETSIVVAGVRIRLFSTRFAPRNADFSLEETLLGVQQAGDFVRTINADEAVIFGGDFNSEAGSPEMQSFVAASGLRDVFVEMPDNQHITEPEKRIDFIFYRGRYRVSRMEQRSPWSGGPAPSDHSWVYVELQSTEPDRCTQIRSDIAAIGRRIEPLQQQMGRLLIDFDKDDETIRKRREELKKKINDLSKQRGKLQEEAAALGCNAVQ